MASAVRNSMVAGTVVAAVIATTLLYTMLIMKDKREDVCKTKGCVNTAARILNAMNTSANPCEEFYEYACGGWIASNPIPDDKASVGQFSVLTDNNAKTLHAILSSDYSNDREAVKKVKMYFKSCMDEDAISDLGAQPALDFLETFGEIPLFGDGFDDKSFSLEKYLATTKSRVPDVYGSISAPLISMAVATDDKNSTENAIMLDQPKLGMPGRHYYLKETFNSTLEAYRQYMTDFLSELWKSREKDNANSTKYSEEDLTRSVDEMIRLETDLARIMESQTKRLDIVGLYKKMSLNEMSQIVSLQFNWHKFVKLVMAKVGVAVNKDTEVISYGTPYFSKFMSVLEKYGNRVVKNYVIWMDLHARVKLLSKKFRDTQAIYRKAVLGTSEERERWKTCVARANNLLPMSLGAMFVQSVFTEKTKKVVQEMVTNVLKFFDNQLPSLDWMDEETKNAAKAKAGEIMRLLAYPDYIIDDDDPRLDKEHENLTISEGNYFESENNIYNLQVNENLRKINKPVNRNKWLLGPATVNAYYSPNRNLIAFPAAILQPPFFDPNYPYVMNYGAIGSIIGHELTHGFDTMGSRYDKEGNLVNWWSNFSQKHFEDKAQCVKDQYSGFFYKSAQMFVNGNLSIGENIADLGGIRLTYGGYQLWKNEHAEKEFKLPGLEEYSPEKLLFLANAQVWCGMERPQTAKRRIATGVHSPKIFRVIGASMNFEEFGKAFECTRGKDRLFPKPEDTCRVW